MMSSLPPSRHPIIVHGPSHDTTHRQSTTIMRHPSPRVRDDNHHSGWVDAQTTAPRHIPHRRRAHADPEMHSLVPTWQLSVLLTDIFQTYSDT